MITAYQFVELLADAPDLPEMFNPFRDRCLIHDLPNGPEIRKKNLEKYLEAHQRLNSKVLWVAEAASYNGSRRSGLFFIPETQFSAAAKLINAQPFEKATHTSSRASLTATFLWESILALPAPPLTFNALPFHPHLANRQLSNRTPSKKELGQNLQYLETLIQWFQPEVIVAIGRKAEYSCSKLGVKATYARHPSQGGQSYFRKTIKEIYHTWPINKLAS